MPKHIRNRFWILAALTAAAIICMLPSLLHPLPSWWKKPLPTQGMRLGLDLQGGMYLILKVDIPRAVHHQLEVAVADLHENLRQQGMGFRQPQYVEPERVHLRLIEPAAMQKVREILTAQFPNLAVAGSEDNGSLDLTLSQAELKNIKDNAVRQSLEVIRNRIDQFGVEEPVIARQGEDEISLQLPGIKDPNRALQLIGRTAQLEFKMVDANASVNLPVLIDQALRSGRLKADYTYEQLNDALKSDIPADDEIYIEKRVDHQTGATETFPILLKKATLMTGEALKSAQVRIGGRFGEPYVSLSFNPMGAQRFERITRQGVGQRLAIILDNIVQSAPVIQEPITGGNAQITGSFTAEQAHDLAIVLRAGALPAPVNIVQNLTVGPSLGKDSIHKGLLSTLLGGVLVVLFMAIYYRISGVIANFALMLNLLLMVAVLSLLHATLTLPGIAGIVLSIGMAVDSNVLIFERMREELALGKPVYTSVQSGYDKAFWTIIDAHVTTLITAVALFLFGTGPIKGFAVTLSIGVALNLFTALYGTRVAYDFMHFRHWLKGFHFLHVLRKTNLDFIKLRRMAFALSTVLVLLGLFAGVQIQRGKANLGVELSGGALLQYKAAHPFQLERIRTALSQNGLSENELQEVPSENVLIVRLKNAQQTVGASADKVSAVLRQAAPQAQFVLESKTEIGASVSQALKRAALIAILISFAGIIVYIAWRFNRRYGVAAAVATFHDVLTVLGIFYLLDKEMTMLVITALLTLAGYSLTDTVVVFDRIRENRRTSPRQPLAEVINRSINEVLSRTVVTSGTVLLVLLALLVLGGILLRDFALALLIGVVVGTYSSIFVASPIVFVWETWSKKKRR